MPDPPIDPWPEPVYTEDGRTVLVSRELWVSLREQMERQEAALRDVLHGYGDGMTAVDRDYYRAALCPPTTDEPTPTDPKPDAVLYADLPAFVPEPRDRVDEVIDRVWERHLRRGEPSE